MILFLCIEFSSLYGSGAFLASAILSFILLPSKTPFFYFALLYGWYPVLKHSIERKIKKPVLRVGTKAVVWMLASIVEEMLARALLGYTKSTLIMVCYIVIQFFIYILYDKCLNVLAVQYVFKWRKHLFRGK